MLSIDKNSFTTVLSQVSQVNEQMFENRQKIAKKKKKKIKDSGALGALKSLAFSILDQWLFSAKKSDVKSGAEVSKRFLRLSNCAKI